MDHFGEYLRKERKLRNISLEEISEATKISAHLLKAIEEVHTEILPDEVFVKGFLRAYAKYVGLDDDDVVLRYEGFLKDTEKHFEAPSEKKKDKHPKVWIVLAILVVSIGTILLFVWLGPKRSPIKTTEEAQSTQEMEIASEEKFSIAHDEIPPSLSREELSKEDAMVKESPEQIISAEEKAEKEGTPEKALVETGPGVVPVEKASLVLEAQVLAETWIRYNIDENPAKEILLQSEESFIWKAKNKLKLLIGNAGGLELTLNGQPMDRLGKEGEVIHLELPKKTEPTRSSTNP